MATTITENKELVRRVEDAVNARDYDAFDDIFAEDFVLERELEEIHGVDGYVEYLERLLDTFPDLTVTFEEMIAEDETVVVRYSGVGTHEGKYNGVEPTEKQVAMSGLRIVRIEGEKITDVWSRANNLSLLGQLGVVDLPTE